MVKVEISRGICESVSTVAYSGINNVEKREREREERGDRRLRDMQMSTSARSNRYLLISLRVANRHIQLTRYHKGYTYVSNDTIPFTLICSPSPSPIARYRSIQNDTMRNLISPLLFFRYILCNLILSFPLCPERYFIYLEKFKKEVKRIIKIIKTSKLKKKKKNRSIFTSSQLILLLHFIEYLKMIVFRCLDLLFIK